MRFIIRRMDDRPTNLSTDVLCTATLPNELRFRELFEHEIIEVSTLEELKELQARVKCFEVALDFIVDTYWEDRGIDGEIRISDVEEE